MKTIKKMLVLGGIASALCLGAGSVMAQADDGGGPPGGGPPAGGPPPGFDPAQGQKMMMDRLRDQMRVKDDAEWNLLQAQIKKVLEARMQLGPPGGGMGMPGRGGPGSPGGPGGPPTGRAWARIGRIWPRTARWPGRNARRSVARGE